MIKWPCLLVAVLAFALPPSALAQAKKPTAAELLKGIKAPPGFAVTLFAAPPEVNYPTCLACAPTGEVFIGIDQNGSLDAKPGRGRVLRCLDTTGAGTMDKHTVFCTVDSPRGLFFDHKTLYVLHPPFLSAFHDDDGDGVADRSEVLVKGIGFDLKFRGADHTTNGIRMGIDGWIYIAVGDYGFIKAEGKDGRTAQLHGGGIARVRSDGTGLELYAVNTRNIYDVAIDPLMNVFTRDNTNDGGGWDVRLSHILPTGNYCYPSLYQRFADELVPPLADYGGGSPTGALFLDEPGFPAGFGHALYTCEWGRSAVYRHPLKAKGASFQAEQTPFVTLPRPTDIDVDGSGRLYISSWRDGGFTYGSPFVGYVIRVAPPNFKPRPFPALAQASAAELLEALASDSHVRRLHAQRAIVRRGDKTLVEGLKRLVAAPQALPVRVAALYAIEQMLGAAAADFLASSAATAEIQEYALRALVDLKGELPAAGLAALVHGLTSPQPRVRLIAAYGVGRRGSASLAPRLIPLVADADPNVAHVAINALIVLKGGPACFAALDTGAASVRAGCLRVLQALHEPAVVAGLIQRLQTQGRDRQDGLLKALCRLYHKEADWDGKWWGTRPDTTGPYFKHVTWAESDKIGAALQQALAHADAAQKRWLLTELYRNKIQLPGALAMLLRLADEDPAFRASAVETLGGLSPLPAEALALLEKVAASDKESAPVRAKALRALAKTATQPATLQAAMRGFASLGAAVGSARELSSVWEDFTRDARHKRELPAFLKLAESETPLQRELAFSVLLHLYESKGTPTKAKTSIQSALDRAWAKPAQAVSLLNAIRQTRSEQFAFQVRARQQDQQQEVRAAAVAAGKALGLDRERGKRSVIGPRPYEEVVAAALKEKGDAKLGAQLYLRQGCVTCHTLAKTEPPKGPFLGDVAARYKRPELLESILKPGAKIAQGFETQVFVLTNGQILEGFVVREAGDEIEIRNVQGIATVLPRADIDERSRRDISIMPNGLADNLTVQELAALLAFLESLNEK
jgi:putative heme-binding domain-containing protein